VTLDLDAVRVRLLAERAAVARELAARRGDVGRSLEDETDEDGSDSHLGDSASETYERGLDVTLLDNAADLLERYDVALLRLDAGTYGSCADCGRPIGEERLEALPYATLCLDDARRHEAR
jgi:RNA polymerase-binding protein DksA